MKRVLHVFGRLDRGGAESRTMDIYRAIDRTQIQFDFIVHTNESCAFDEEITSLGGKIYSFPRFNMKNYITYRRFWNTFLSEHPEYQIVHVHVANFAFVIIPLLKARKIPMRIVHARSTSDSIPKRILVRFTRRLMLRNSTHYLAVSKKAAAFVFGVKTKAAIVPNAIEARKFAFDNDTRIRMRKELSIDDYFVIGHVGRMTPEKHHSFLVHMMKGLQERKFKALLLLVGDGPLREQLERQAVDMGIEARFLGVRSDVAEIMQAMDIFVLPSLYEGLPGAVLEAQAAGLKCLISDNVTRECEVIPELCSFLPVNQGSELWQNAIIEAAKNGYERRNTLPEFITSGFDIAEAVHWYERLYGDIDIFLS